MYQTYKTILTGAVVTGPLLWSSGAFAASGVASNTTHDFSRDAFSLDGSVQQVALQDLKIAPVSPYAQDAATTAPGIQLADASQVSASSLIDGFDADMPALETLLPGAAVLPATQPALAKPLLLETAQTAYSRRPLNVESASALPHTASTASTPSYEEESFAAPVVEATEGEPLAVPVVEATSHIPDSRLETALESVTDEIDEAAPFYSEGLLASFDNREGVASETVLPDRDVVSPPHVAQLNDEEIRQQLLITPNPATEPELDVLDRRPQPIPSSSFITPNAYGADWGDFYIGSAGSTESTDGNNDGLDASASLGMGFGNAVDNVGVELNVGIISIDGFADDGSVGFKVHKLFPKANNLGVAVGWTNAVTWGAAQRDEDTIYGVVTQRFDLRPNKDNPMPLTTSLGIGTGAFRSTGAIEAGDNPPNVFGSVGLRVIPQVSLVSSWSGRALGLAASAAPFKLPVVFTAGVSDLTDNTDEGTQFVGGLGYSFGF